LLHCYKVTDMSKVVRLPDTLADFFKQYPSKIGELVNQIEAGLLSLNIDVTALQGVTATNTDIQAMIDDALRSKIKDLREEFEEQIATFRDEMNEAIATAKKAFTLSDERSSDSSLESDSLPSIEAIAAATAIDINKAMEIAQKHGYSGNAQTLRNWSKRSFTNKTAEAQNESKAKLKEVGLMPHYDGENYVWLAV
jgi:demethoxyubiquinone hydroxylase (CLK1/Coq7/Cat5 family)